MYTLMDPATLCDSVPDAPSKEETDSEAPEEHDLSRVIGTNLKALRRRRGHSLERLAGLSGVSRAMLSQIELGRSMPTIKIVWKIAKALDIPFSALIADGSGPVVSVIRAATSQFVRSASGKATSRALFPFRSPRRFEFHEWQLLPLASERISRLAVGTMANLVVAEGTLELQFEEDRTLLSTGDAAFFNADAPHVYRNAGGSTLRFFVSIVFSEPIP